MNELPERLSKLLGSSGVRFEQSPARSAPSAPLSEAAWAYSVDNLPIQFFIYQFANQGDLDASLDSLERQGKGTQKDVELAQNGAFLLAVYKPWAVVPDDEQAIDRAVTNLLAAFSGEEERPG